MYTAAMLPGSFGSYPGVVCKDDVRVRMLSICAGVGGVVKDPKDLTSASAA